ncbi:MAG: hypothetical protein RBT68_09440 [Spirochaetia bacterium]|jgi:hypothetical protein|nr:hypothetical protein [Spirochaetia bacterium]
MVLIILGGCDSYSLLDQFILNSELRLTPQSTTLKPGETSLLYLEGGTAPYLLYATNGGVYDDGTALDLGSIDDSAPSYSYTAGNSIGPVTIRFSDSLGFATSTTITVVPHAPDSVIADGTIVGPQTVEITWSYPFPDKIQGFRIMRSQDGTTFTVLDGAESLPRLPTSFVDGTASPSSMNYYVVYAIAGSYQSANSIEASAWGNPP